MTWTDKTWNLAHFLDWDDEDWMKDSACRDMTAIFFEEDDQFRAYAKHICSQCSVLRECREYALQRNDYGIWGGMTAKERHVIKHGVHGRISTYKAGCRCEPCKERGKHYNEVVYKQARERYREKKCG